MNPSPQKLRTGWITSGLSKRILACRSVILGPLVNKQAHGE